MHTVIVGGGFAGVKAAKEISKLHLGKVTLISDEEHFIHHATLYSTATGRAVAESVVALEEAFAEHGNVELVHDHITDIEPSKRLVKGAKTYHYDKLILALGSVTNYFGMNDVKKHAFGLRTLEDVREFNSHIRKEIIKDRRLDKNYVIIGGGPTGVELAGALHEYLEHLMTVHVVDDHRINITLVEAAPRILPRMDKTASNVVRRRLTRMGIRVLEGQKVEHLGRDVITIDGKKYPTKTAVWTSGVANNPFFAAHADIFDLDPCMRVNVNDQLEARANIYVVGDNNTVEYSGQAWPALDQAEFVSDDIRRIVTRQPRVAFVPKKPTTGIPVGEHWAYVQKGRVYAAGLIGHLWRRQMELHGYKRLLPNKMALGAWRAHKVPQIDLQ